MQYIDNFQPKNLTQEGKQEAIKRFIENTEKDYFIDCLTERWIQRLKNVDMDSLGKIQAKLKHQRSLLEFLYEINEEKDY